MRIIAVANSAVSNLQGKDATVLAVTGKANQAIADLSALAQGFADNPGRRLISLWLGMLLGLAAAAVLHLDLVATTVGSSAAWHGSGVALTGIALGLGSGPVHEVVQSIQAYKVSQKAMNTTPTTTQS
jgi:hypothetical protein